MSPAKPPLLVVVELLCRFFGEGNELSGYIISLLVKLEEVWAGGSGKIFPVKDSSLFNCGRLL